MENINSGILSFSKVKCFSLAEFWMLFFWVFFFPLKKSTWTTTTCAQFLQAWEPETPGLSWLWKFSSSLKCSYESETLEWNFSVVGSPWNQILWKHGFPSSLAHGLARNLTKWNFVNRTVSKLNNFYKISLVLTIQIGNFWADVVQIFLWLQSVECNPHGQDLELWVLDVSLVFSSHVLSLTSYIPRTVYLFPN